MQLQKAVKNIQEDKTYYVIFKDKVGNYNFETNTFPIAWENNGMIMLDDFWESLAKKNLSGAIDLTDLRIYFRNSDEFSELPLSPQRARYFVDHRKSANGDIDRSIYFLIQFNVKEMVGAENFQRKILNPGEKYLMYEIKRIDFFEDSSCRYNYLSTLKK